MNRGLLAMCLAASLLAGCSGPEAPGGPVSAGEPAHELAIGLTEWTVVTGDAIAAPGDVRLVVVNSGGTSHDLEVVGERGTWATPELAPGESRTLRIEAAPGEVLQLTCTLAGHALSGMTAELPVADR